MITTNRLSAISLFWVVVLATALQCAAPAQTQRGTSVSQSSRTGSLVLRVPATAEVFVDGQKIAAIDAGSTRKLNLTSGEHFIDVKSTAGQQIWHKKVLITPDQQIAEEVEFNPLASSSVPAVPEVHPQECHLGGSVECALMLTDLGREAEALKYLQSVPKNPLFPTLEPGATMSIDFAKRGLKRMEEQCTGAGSQLAPRTLKGYIDEILNDISCDHLSMAKDALTLGDTAKAAREIEKVKDSSTSKVPVRAAIRYANGDARSALVDIDKAIQLNPESASIQLPKYQVQKAWMLADSGRFEDAKRTCELIAENVFATDRCRIIVKLPFGKPNTLAGSGSSPYPPGLLGLYMNWRSLQRLGFTSLLPNLVKSLPEKLVSGGISDLQQAEEQYRGCRGGFRNPVCGRHALATGRYQEALETADFAISDSALPVWAYNHRAKAYFGLHNEIGAKADLARVQDLLRSRKPDRAAQDYTLDSALMLFDLGYVSEARTTCERALGYGRDLFINESCELMKFGHDVRGPQQTFESSESTRTPAATGSLPEPRRMSAADLSPGQTRYEAKNSTPYSIRITLTGPATKELILAAGESASLVLPTGQYRVVASVSGRNVTSMSGQETYESEFAYMYEFYIRTLK